MGCRVHLLLGLPQPEHQWYQGDSTNCNTIIALVRIPAALWNVLPPLAATLEPLLDVQWEKGW